MDHFQNEDFLYLNLPNSWFIDFLELKTKEIPCLLTNFKKDVMLKKKFLCTTDPEKYLEKIQNLYKYNNDKELNKKATNVYIALFKEMFFGNYVEFLLILQVQAIKKQLLMSIKMEKKNIKLEMSQEELHIEFDYLARALQEYFNELI